MDREAADLHDSKLRAAAPRVAPHAGPTRCPYCHDDCAPEAEVSVCRTCLSRHHAACWSEGGACASCGASEYLDAATRGEARAPAPALTRKDLALWGLLVGTSALLLGVVQASEAFYRLFQETGVQLPALTRLCLAPAQHPFLASLAIVAWVATAALARQRRRAFVGVVLAGVAITIPIMVIGLFLPLIELIQSL